MSNKPRVDYYSTDWKNIAPIEIDTTQIREEYKLQTSLEKFERILQGKGIWYGGEEEEYRSGQAEKGV
jgi:hypothetical protein